MSVEFCWKHVRRRALTVGPLFFAIAVHAQSPSVNLQRNSIQVPEDHIKPDGRQITLAYVRLHTRASASSPPIVYLAGGPGGSGIKDMLSERFRPYWQWLEFADIIALDQRGTGASSPTLICPMEYQADRKKPAERSEVLRQYRTVARRCADYWRARGVHLRLYTTEANADDVASLAQHLGVTKVRLFGASYGSHLGLSILRRHPHLVDRAILGAVEGPDQTIKLPAAADQQLALIAEQIRLDPRFGGLLPDFNGLVRSLVAKADTTSVETKLEDGHPVRVTGFDLRLLLADMISRRSDIQRLPAVFLPASAGNFTPLAKEISQRFRRDQVNAMGAVMDCASSVSPSRWRVIVQQAKMTLLGTTPDFPLPEWCPAWGIRPIPETFRTPVTSDVPVLFIAGDLDSQTPPSNAYEIRQGFRNGRLFLIHRAGHESSLFLSSPQLLSSITTFMKGGDAGDQRFDAPPLTFTPILEDAP